MNCTTSKKDASPSTGAHGEGFHSLLPEYLNASGANKNRPLGDLVPGSSKLRTEERPIRSRLISGDTGSGSSNLLPDVAFRLPVGSKKTAPLSEERLSLFPSITGSTRHQGGHCSNDGAKGTWLCGGFVKSAIHLRAGPCRFPSWKVLRNNTTTRPDALSGATHR